MKKRALLLCLLIATISSVAQKNALYHRATIYIDTPVQTIHQLKKLELEADHGLTNGASLTSDFSEQDLRKAEKAGFKTEIIINNVSEYYAHQNDSLKTIRYKVLGSGSPSMFKLGSYAGYYTYEELLNILDEMHEKYPELITAKTQIGTFESIEGRPLYWLRLSNNPEVEQHAKPKVLYTALHHAREPGSITQMIYFLWYMLEQYEKNEKIKALIDNTELYFIPCVNPDGYIYNIQNSPNGGGMWRKNMKRDTNGRLYGVDLNRNYSYGWDARIVGQGTSNNKMSDVYKGEEPFSEPEVKAVKWFSETHRFGVAMNCHTYGEMLLYPWSHYDINNPPYGKSYTNDSVLYRKHGNILTEESLYKHGLGFDLLYYFANGDIIDWMYGEQTSKNKIMAFTPEFGTGFYMHSSKIESESKKVLPMNIKAAQLLLPYAHISDTVSDKSAKSYHVAYILQQAGLQTGDISISLHAVDQWLLPDDKTDLHRNMQLLETTDGELSYSLHDDIKSGQEVKYFLLVDNGIYTDTVQNSFVYFANDFDETVIDDESIEVSPNPTNDYIDITLNVPNKLIGSECLISDMQGRVLHRFSIIEDITRVNLSQFRNGVYILKVLTDGLSVKNMKIVVSH